LVVVGGEHGSSVSVRLCLSVFVWEESTERFLILLPKDDHVAGGLFEASIDRVGSLTHGLGKLSWAAEKFDVFLFLDCVATHHHHHLIHLLGFSPV
jgi:hypothetical protein